MTCGALLPGISGLRDEFQIRPPMVLDEQAFSVLFSGDESTDPAELLLSTWLTVEGHPVKVIINVREG